MALSKRDTDILDFEGSWWNSEGSKRAAIRDQLSLSSTRYYQVLNALIDSQEALEYDPLVVTRLRKRRRIRSRIRVLGRSAGGPR